MTHPRITPDMLSLAADRLAPRSMAFWTWDADGQAVTWPDGRTIVFREELRQVVERLAPSGLPSIESLLLLLAVCRDGWKPISTDPVRAILGALGSDLKPGVTMLLPQIVSQAWQQLERIAQLPAELRHSTEAKAVLVEMVFGTARTIPPDEARAIVAALDADVWREALPAGFKPCFMFPSLKAGLKDLHPGLPRVDESAWRLRLRTGLDRLVVPAEVELPPQESLRAFVGRLRSDRELSGLGRLAHDLMAAVSLPRSVSEPEELPLGGVSDITNRGPLDRLLTSELANDDLTLAVRVAVNEALYVRRESPPKTPVADGLILIDSGIRLWGVPRVFAAAASLALAATSDSRGTVRAFRAAAEGDLQPVELGTRNGLIEHLEALEAAPHPAASLEAFLKQVRQSGQPTDAVLVTHADVLADPEFRRALSAVAESRLFLAAVERSGRFQLLSAGKHGVKPLREARFELDKLLAPAAVPTAPLVEPLTGTQLPAILSVKPFPLLLPHEVDGRHAAFHEQFGAVTVTRDGRLMHWQRRSQAARQLTSSVPPGAVWFVSIDDDGLATLVVGNPPRQRLWRVTVDLHTGEQKRQAIELELSRLLHVAEIRGALFVIGQNDIYQVGSGRSHGWLACPSPIRWRNGRFFSDGHAWYALAYDGVRSGLERVSMHRAMEDQRVVALFDRQGLDGPWAVTGFGDVVSTADGRRISTGLDAQVESVTTARGGSRLVMRLRHDTARLSDSEWLIDLNDPYPAREILARGCMMRRVAGNLFFALEPGLAALVQSRKTLSRRFQSIYVDRGRQLTLVARRGRRSSIVIGGQCLVLRQTTDGDELTEPRPFEPIASPSGDRYQLSAARWADGSVALLDSRGLLHLKSSERSVPKTTIVLYAGGALAGWSSQGGLWGLAYFTGIGRRERLSLIEAYRGIEQFTAYRRPARTRHVVRIPAGPRGAIAA